VSIEVGLQNAGMASGLAIAVLKSSDAGLAPAIFGPWMNASGSVLASFWRRRLPGPSATSAERAPA
jgi:BASS family bile acid:Na+ symporter